MKIKTNRKNKYTFFALLTAIISSAYFLHALADNSISQIDQSESSGSVSDDTQKKLDELQRRAEIYRQIIEIKHQQSSSLSNQLSITDSSIQQVQNQIDATNQQINDYNHRIINLTAQIKNKEDLIESQKLLLADLLQSFYMLSQTSYLNAYLNDGNFASFLVTKDRISQTGDKIKNLIDTIAEEKQKLEAQSAELDQQKTQIVTAQQKLQQQHDSLNTVKDQRQELLDKTKGEEARYAQLLQRVEEQKQQLLDIDQFASSNISIGGLSVADYISKNQPPSSLNASLNWYYSQKDSKWANQTIGNSNSTMKAYGCAVSAVAMVFTNHGNDVTPSFLARQPIFSWDLISWPSSWPSAKLTMSSEGMSHGNLEWKKIDTQIAKGNPIIVYIEKTQGKGGHYVVIHHKESATGKYVVHDPYFGPNVYLDTSRALVGSMGTQSGTIVNQMIIYN